MESLKLEILKDKRKENSKRINILLHENKRLADKIQAELVKLKSTIYNLNQIGREE